MSTRWFDIDIALDCFARHAANKIGTKLEECRIIRDVFGKLSIAVSDKITSSEIEALKCDISSELEAYLATPKFILLPTSSIAQTLIKENGVILRTSEENQKYYLVDRRLAGEDWLQQPSGQTIKVPLFAFYGLKGGVGRSTALSIAAAELAHNGMNVLVLDLDLEAPGLGSILLTPDREPDYGVLDWLASGSIGAPIDEMIPDMIGGSPFTNNSGVVDVVPASGKSTLSHPSGFMSKIARAYTPGASNGMLKGLNFTGKIQKLIGMLSEYRSYDAILVDVRAGLHETSAASLLGMGAKVFLFGTNTAQTFSGYKILLSNVRQAIESWPHAPDLRSNFRMIHGRASPTYQEKSEFKSSCWRLWIETLYDAVDDELESTSFSFDLDDPDGPHFPWVISHSENYISFDTQRDANFLSRDAYLATFGNFADNFVSLVKSSETR